MTNLYCYNPEPKNKLIYVLGLCLIFAVVGGIIVHAVFFSFRQMKRNKEIICEETIEAQKTVLSNLLILSSVPIFLGIVPIIIGEVFVYFRYLPNAQLALEILGIIKINHGTVYGIVILYIFKDYRRAVKCMFIRLTAKLRIKSTVSTVNSSH